MKIRALLFAITLAFGIAADPCTTPYNTVSCTDCPRTGSYYGCWQSGSSTYSVFGTPTEVWCTDVDGWCDINPGCTTMSSIATSVDCDQNTMATQSTICCIPAF